MVSLLLENRLNKTVSGTSHWSDEANELFQSLCMSKIIQAEIVGHNKHDNVAYVELYVLDDDKNVTTDFWLINDLRDFRWFEWTSHCWRRDSPSPSTRQR